jgi:hypothetical protein
MSGWIKLEKDLLTDPRLMRRALWLAQSIEMSVTQDAEEGWKECNGRPLPAVTLVLGALAHLWMIADTHIGEDDILPLGTDEIDEILGLPGFTELLPQDWLQVVDSDHVKLPGYHAHNGTEAKERALNRKRVAKSREKKKLNGITHGNGKALPDQDQDQDLYQKKKSEKTRTARKNAPYPPEFLDFKMIYPDRSGDQGWPKARRAANARLKEGHTWTEMMEGARRYAAYAQADGIVGTPYVKQACTFLGPDLFFQLPWDPPKTKAEAHRDHNIEQSQEWLKNAN